MITLINEAFFLISSMVLGLLNQLQIFWQLCLLELLAAFTRSRATQVVALDISKAFDRVWHAGFLHKRRSYWISGQIFGLFSSFVNNRQLRMALNRKFLQEHPVKAGVPQGLILALHFSYYTLMMLLMMLSVVLLSMLMILLFTLNVIRHLICGNNQNRLLNVNLIFKALDLCRKWFVDFNAGKAQVVSFDQSNNTGAIDVKMDGSVPEEKCSFKMLGLTFSSKLDWASYIISFGKTVSKKIGALSFFLLKFLCSISL